MKCGGCGERFPKNDFLKFYKSGLDELGIFRLYRANRELLFNVEHPDPKDPLHLFAVDDGAGWLDEAGQRFYWIGRYNDIRMNHYSAGMAGYAGDCLKSPSTSYRRRLALLIYRKAMLYPEFDWRECWKLGMFHSSGGSGDGRAIGRIWENSAGLNSFAYDLVYDLIGKDAGLLAAIQARMPKHLAPKTGDDIRRFIEKNYIGEVLDAYFGSWPGIRSNVGPNLKGLITTAIVLDDPVRTPAALDRVYSQQMGDVFETYIDRDGAGYEGAPGYTFGWSQSLHSIAKTIARTKYRKYGLYQRYPIWRRMYLTPYLITALDRFTPHVEDHATCGKPGMTAVRMNTYLDAFQRMKDPIFAQIAYVANGNKFDGMIGDPTQEDPASIQEEVKKVIEKHGPIELPSTNLNGYGMVMLRSGKGDHRRAAFLYYGRQGYAGHGQYDSLNMGIFFNGINVSPDMGYPEYTTGHPKSNLWTRNTIAHNCVIVDRSRQRGLWIGNCLGFHQGPGLVFAEVDSTRAYFPGQPKSMYRRTLAMIDIDEESSYFVDVFRIRGGREHVYSFHGADGNLKVTGTNLARQETGTYLGADTEYGKGGRQGSRSGYQFLHDVSRSENVPGGFLADWSILDYFKIQRKPGQVHLRLTMLNDCDDVAIATGHPAWSMPAGTESKKYRPIRYLLARRRPKEKKSDFVTVIEPSLGKSKLQRIQLLPAADHAVIVRVTAEGGRVDTFASSLSAKTEVKTEDFSATGRWAFLSTEQKAPEKMFLMGGTSIQAGNMKFQLASASFRGKVDAFGNTPEGEAWFTTNASLPVKGSLTDHQIRFNTSTQYKDVFGPRDTWFEIRNVQRTPDGQSRVALGDFRLTTGYKDAKNHKLGLRTLFNVGDSFEIPSCVQFQRTEGGWRLHSTSDVSMVLSETTSFLCRVGSGEWQELSGIMKEGAIPCSRLPNGNLDLRSNLKE